MHPTILHKLTQQKLRLTFAIIFTTGLAISASAQKTTEDGDNAIVMDKMFVTGSNIPLAGEAPVAPVLSISQAQIADTGVSNDLLEVIRKSAPQFSGNANLGGTNGNIASGSTNGGSELSLRNAATLVLVNGRRLANAPVAGAGGSVFVDVNAIPVSAIKKIEILTDGASAIYGSDAVAGVVNITLKSNFDGLAIGGRYAGTQNEGKYREKSAYGVAGANTSSGFKIVASYEWTKTDPLYNGERAFSRPSYGTTNFAGVIQTQVLNSDGVLVGDKYYYLDPSLKAPKAGTTLAERGYLGPLSTTEILHLFDLSKFVTQRMGNEKKIATFNVEQKFGKIVAYGDMLYSKTDVTSQLNAQPISIKMAADDPNNILGVAVSVRNRFVELPRTYNDKSNSFRGIAGVKGDLTDHWYFDSAINYNHATQEFTNGGLIRSVERAAAVSAGKINLFAREQTAGALDGVIGEAKGNYASDLYSYDFKLVGTDLFMLPGGGISLAAGGELREEKLKATSDKDSQSATFAYDSGTSIDPFDAKRNIDSLFAEAKIPLVGKDNHIPGIYSATLTVAGRHEIYNDGEDPTVPKFALSYQPVNDSLLFRATASSSFSAPTLYSLHSPPAIGYSGQLAEFDGNQANIKTTPVSTLSPSKSHNFNLGVVWTPTFAPGLELSVDFFNIKQTAVISNLNASGVVDAVFHDVEVNGASSQYAKYIHIGDFTGPTVSAPGQISSNGLDNIYYVIPAYSNLGAQKIRGVDVKIGYNHSFGNLGKLRLDSTSTYYSYYDIQVSPDVPYTHTAGLVTGLNGTIARWRTYNTATYSIKGISATLAHTYYSSTQDATWTPDSVSSGYSQQISAYSIFDAHLSYEFKKNTAWFKSATITVGIDNIGNRMPTKSATYDGLSNADVGEFNPIGRLFYVSAEYRF